MGVPIAGPTPLDLAAAIDPNLRRDIYIHNRLDFPLAAPSNGNVRIGEGCLAPGSLASECVAVGYLALQLAAAATVGNTAVGTRSMSGAAVTGSYNIGVGYSPLLNLTSGNDNIGIGRLAMGVGVVTGDRNIGIGRRSLEIVTSGSDNVCIGYLSGLVLTTGDSNTFVGGRTTSIGASAATLQKSAAIGWNAQVSASNTMVLGGTGIDSVAVVIGGTAAVGAEVLRVVGAGRIEGKLTVTGALDPTSVLLSDPGAGTQLWYESNDGQTAPVSGAATGRIRYNNATPAWEISMQGGAYSAIVTAASLTPLLTNYFYKPGLAGGQTAIGGTGAGEGITYTSTSNATKGKHTFGSNLLVINEATSRVGIGRVPVAQLDIYNSAGSAGVWLESTGSYSQLYLTRNGAAGIGQAQGRIFFYNTVDPRYCGEISGYYEAVNSYALGLSASVNYWGLGIHSSPSGTSVGIASLAGTLGLSAANPSAPLDVGGNWARIWEPVIGHYSYLLCQARYNSSAYFGSTGDTVGLIGGLPVDTGFVHGVTNAAISAGAGSILFYTASNQRGYVSSTGEFRWNQTAVNVFQVAQTGGGTPALIVDTTNTRVGAGITPTESLHAAANILAETDLKWKSGTAFTGTLDHAISAARTWTFPDFSGTVTLGANAYKTADETVTNSTTLQNDDHLTVTLDASSKYHFRFYVPWTTASVTAGIKVALNGTVGITSLKADLKIGLAGVIYSAWVRATAFGTTASAILTGANVVEIEGTIETSTSGTLLLEWAQSVADAVNGTTVQRNAVAVLEKIG